MTTFLLEEEKLAVCFQGYPVLYDKAVFHNKNEKQSAWGTIADELQLVSWKGAKLALRGKCLNTSYFWSVFPCIQSK